MLNCPSCGERMGGDCRAPFEQCPGIARRAAERDAKRLARASRPIPRGWYLLAAVAVSCALWAAILTPIIYLVTIAL